MKKRILIAALITAGVLVLVVVTLLRNADGDWNFDLGADGETADVILGIEEAGR